METRAVRVVIDEATVASATNVFDVIEPLWELVETHDTWQRYEETLRPFSLPQRHLFAIQWYRAEVKNGGHDQFFSNSTGVVWWHALQGLEAIGLPEAAEILRSASERLGWASRDRLTREVQWEASLAAFDDLDERFFALERTGILDEKMLAFARQHAAAFRFDGTVEKIVPPDFGDGATIYLDAD